MTSKESRPVWRGAEGKGVAKLPHRRPTRPPQPGLHPKPSAATMSYIEHIKFTDLLLKIYEVKPTLFLSNTLECQVTWK